MAVTINGSGQVPVKIAQSIKTDTFTTTSTSFTDVTGLSVNITPSSSSNKILVLVQSSVYNTAGAGCHLSLLRDSTQIFLGDTAGSRTRATAGLIASRNGASVEWFGAGNNGNIIYLDSPATTSSVTYKIQARVGTTGTLVLNRGGNDGDDANWWRTPSSIIVMELAYA